jgi:hypothetical protein
MAGAIQIDSLIIRPISGSHHRSGGFLTVWRITCPMRQGERSQKAVTLMSPTYHKL